MKSALKITSLLLFSVLILNIFTITPSKGLSVNTPKTIEISKETDHKTLQYQIDSAPEGSTIVLKPGVYSETFSINKQITLQGEDKEKTIIDAEGIETGIEKSFVCNQIQIP